MKLKTVIAASLAISVLFAFTGCGNSSSTDNTNTKQESSSTTDNTNTKQESSSTTETGSADELNEKRDDLYQQENQLFADHKDAWGSLVMTRAETMLIPRAAQWNRQRLFL